MKKEEEGNCDEEDEGSMRRRKEMEEINMMRR